VPLRALPPQLLNSLKLTIGKFLLQSKALGKQTLSFQPFP
jgi:hypothetical protein